MFSALIIGFGSIGRKHADLLHTMDDISQITLLSSQEGLPYQTIKSLDDALDINPDYIVVASPTSNHFAQLEFLEQNLKGKKILVEKPLFDSSARLRVANNEIYVAYNLRFHPLVQKVREVIADRKLWTVNAFCGSYLPDWRPGRDYRTTSSAQEALGGGVLRDLSHELDYIQWFVGQIQIDYAISKKVSNLDIDTDDLLLFSGRNDSGAHVLINLNYFTREPIRQIILDGDGVSIRGDLLENTLTVFLDGNKSFYKWPESCLMSSYRSQHRAVLDGDRSKLCSFEEGIRIVDLMEQIRSSSC